MFMPALCMEAAKIVLHVHQIPLNSLIWGPHCSPHTSSHTLTLAVSLALKASPVSHQHPPQAPWHHPLGPCTGACRRTLALVTGVTWAGRLEPISAERSQTLGSSAGFLSLKMVFLSILMMEKCLEGGSDHEG